MSSEEREVVNKIELQNLCVFQLTQSPTESSVPTLIRRIDRKRNSRD